MSSLRGRPVKYATEKERQLAKHKQHRLRQKRYRERQKRVQASSSQTSVLSIPDNSSEPEASDTTVVLYSQHEQNRRQHPNFTINTTLLNRVNRQIQRPPLYTTLFTSKPIESIQDDEYMAGDEESDYEVGVIMQDGGSDDGNNDDPHHNPAELNINRYRVNPDQRPILNIEPAAIPADPVSPIMEEEGEADVELENEPGVPEDNQAIEQAVKFLARQVFKFQGCSAEEHQHEELLQEEEKNRRPVYGPDGIAPHTMNIDIPNILDSPEFLQHNTLHLSTDDWRRLYCGGNLTVEEPPRTISFAEEPPSINEKANPSITFDIDSVLAIPRSLAVAKGGLKISFYPPRTSNIQSDIHIALPLQTTGSRQTKNVPIHNIPHIHLGTLAGFYDLQLFILFPGLYFSGRPNNFLSDNDLERLYDKIIFPALYKVCPAHILQHLPASFQKSKRDCHAAGTEPLTRRTRTTGRTQHLKYMIASQYLDNLWNEMLVQGSSNGVQDIGDMILFLNGKNLKTITKQPNPEDCFSSFLQTWNMTCNGSYLNPEYTWLDYGKEIVDQVSRLPFDDDDDEEGIEERPAYTYLWRQCCLESYAKKAKMGIEKGGTKATLYSWALCQDTGNLNITPTGGNPLRQAGLAYTQLYTSTKEIFDAATTYPFQNEGFEGLCVDPKLNATWLIAGGGSKWDINNIKEGYIASKQRTYESLTTSQRKSYGIREEHRVTIQLLSKIAKEIERRRLNGLSIKFSMDKRPFWIHTTMTITEFLYNNINKFAIGFEYGMSLVKDQSVAWEQTKFMVMFLRILKRSFGGEILSREAGLWLNSKRGGVWGNKGMEGMGFQGSLQDYGYGWLPQEKVDWGEWVFAANYREKITFNDNALQNSYRKRWGDVQHVSDVSRELEQLFETLQRHRDNRQYWNMALRFLSTKCIMYYRQEVWSAIKDDIECPDLEECLQGHVGLSVVGLNTRLKEQLVPYFVQSYNRRKFHPIDRVKYLWYFDDGCERGTWEHKPYRFIFKQVVLFLRRVLAPGRVERWVENHYTRFMEGDWVFPHPIKGKFYQYIYPSAGVKLRSWYSAFHEEGKEWSDRRSWSTGTGLVGGIYMEGQPGKRWLEMAVVADFVEGGKEEDVDMQSIKDRVQERWDNLAFH